MSGGVFVVIVGPDGVGKTTLADRIIGGWSGSAAYFHFLPSKGSPIASRPDPMALPTKPKPPKYGSRGMGWVRLARNLVRFWIAYLVRIRPLVQSGVLVVADRWAYGYIGQPHALRFYGPPLLARLAMHFFPRPDLVINLTAPVEVIASRKDELSAAEIRDELGRWVQVGPGRRVELDASQTVEDLAEEATELIGRQVR